MRHPSLVGREGEAVALAREVSPRVKIGASGVHSQVSNTPNWVRQSRPLRSNPYSVIKEE